MSNLAQYVALCYLTFAAEQMGKPVMRVRTKPAMVLRAPALGRRRAVMSSLILSAVACACPLACNSDSSCTGDNECGAKLSCVAGTCRDRSVAVNENADSAGDGGTAQQNILPMPASCELDDIIRMLLSVDSAKDCGDLTRDAPNATRAIAIECARQSLDAGERFRVRFERQGIDSVVSYAFVATREQERVRVYQAVFDTFGTQGSWTGAKTAWWPCSEFAVRDECDPATVDCFACTNARPLCACAPGPTKSGAPLDVRCMMD